MAGVLAAERGFRPVTWLLADTLRGYFWTSAHRQEWSDLGAAALAAAEAEGDARAVAVARINLGDLCLRSHRHDRAVEHYERAVAHLRHADWPEAEGGRGLRQTGAGAPRVGQHHAGLALLPPCPRTGLPDGRPGPGGHRAGQPRVRAVRIGGLPASRRRARPGAGALPGTRHRLGRGRCIRQPPGTSCTRWGGSRKRCPGSPGRCRSCAR